MTNEVEISKFMSLVLRHEPQALGIELDANGWTDFKSFAERMFVKFGVAETQLTQLIEENPKKRFVVENGKIRANQGHSVAIDIALPPTVPPHILYHGTTLDSWATIQSGGIEKRERNHVHLSADEATAKIVAIRRNGPWAILAIASGEMHAAGTTFYRSENGVWLTAHVAPAYIQLLKTWG